MKKLNRAKNKIIVLSDIHMGTNESTVWYRKNIHEYYLIAVLNYILKNANSIGLLVLLGDIFDFWLYPPHKKPPTIDDIINENQKKINLKILNKFYFIIKK